MRTVRIPDENDVWYNTETRKLYRFRDTAFHELVFDIPHMQPEDTVIFSDGGFESGARKYFSVYAPHWIPLTQIDQNKYAWLPDLAESRTPKGGELWHWTNTGGYYVLQGDGYFLLVYMSLHTSNAIKKGMHVDKHIHNSNIQDNVSGWTFRSEHWKEYLMSVIEENLGSPSSVVFGQVR